MGGLSPTTHAIARNGSHCRDRFPKRNLTRSGRDAKGTRAGARGAEGARAMAGTEPAHDHGMIIINRMACLSESTGTHGINPRDRVIAIEINGEPCKPGLREPCEVEGYRPHPVGCGGRNLQCEAGGRVHQSYGRSGEDKQPSPSSQ